MVLGDDEGGGSLETDAFVHQTTTPTHQHHRDIHLLHLGGREGEREGNREGGRDGKREGGKEGERREREEMGGGGEGGVSTERRYT